MRIAVLADIHGNLQAFEAALAHARTQRPDQIVILGDIVIGSPASAACWALARSLSCPIVRGNHERYLADAGTERGDPLWLSPQYAPVVWALGEFGEAERAAMGALPFALRLPEAPELLFVHAAQRSDHDSLRAHTPEEQLAAMFPAPAASLIVRAHNHVGATRIWGERLIVTAGSVGLPLDGNPTAQYLVLERRPAGWKATHHAVPYDLDAALAHFETSGYLAATGPIGRLYRHELQTASFQIVPFLRAYQRWNAAAPLSLEEALMRYRQL